MSVHLTTHFQSQIPLSRFLLGTVRQLRRIYADVSNFALQTATLITGVSRVSSHKYLDFSSVSVCVCVFEWGRQQQMETDSAFYPLMSQGECRLQQRERERKKIAKQNMQGAAERPDVSFWQFWKCSGREVTWESSEPPHGSTVWDKTALSGSTDIMCVLRTISKLKHDWTKRGVRL